jgi:hypothetical protein
MDITERQILRSVMGVTEEIPATITQRDSQFVIDATSAVIHNLFDAEEPMNKAPRYYEKARRIANELQSFVQHRQKEQWGSDSSYPYSLCQDKELATETRAI